MKLFRDYVMSWQQVGVLKAYVLIIGLLLGSYFSEVIEKIWWYLIALVVIFGVYFVYQLLTNGFDSTK